MYLISGHRRRAKLGVSSSNVITDPSTTATADTATASAADKTIKKVRMVSSLIGDVLQNSSGSIERDNDHLDGRDNDRSLNSEVYRADTNSGGSSSSSSSSDIVAIQWDYSHANNISKYDAEDVDAIELMTFPGITIDQLCKMLKTFIGTQSPYLSPPLSSQVIHDDIHPYYCIAC